MAAGGGGGSYFPRPTAALEKLVQESKAEAAGKRLDSDVNKLLRGMLATWERDPDRTAACLAQVEAAIKDEAEMEQFVFGGSVAKHTYVDGLSDVDALLLLPQERLKGKSPQSVLANVAKLLAKKLGTAQVSKIERGRLAVTITYRDGTELQLLPAMRKGTRVLIPSGGGKGWSETNPKAFQRALTKANERVNGTLVPTIRLFKSINAGLPKQKQLEGYHIESLSLEGAKNYRGPRTVKSLLVHVLGAAADRVIRPIADVTGQSRVVDSYLGKANSTERRIVQDALAAVARKLVAATTADEWRAVIEK